MKKIATKMHKSDQIMPVLRVIDSLPSLLDVVTLRQNGGHQFADTAHLVTWQQRVIEFLQLLQWNSCEIKLFNHIPIIVVIITLFFNQLRHCHKRVSLIRFWFMPTGTTHRIPSFHKLSLNDTLWLTTTGDQKKFD